MCSPHMRVLSRRATQCSLSSIYHLRAAGVPSQEAKALEQIFTRGVMPVIGVFAVFGTYAMASRAGMVPWRHST